MGPGDPKDKEQLLAEEPQLPGRAEVWVCSQRCVVQPLAPGLCQLDEEVLLIPVLQQHGLQPCSQVGHQAQQQEGGAASSGSQALTSVDLTQSLQTVEVL